MTPDALRDTLFSDKVREILDSDFIYLHQETCDFLLEKYSLIYDSVADKSICRFLTPMLTLDDFRPSPATDSKAAVAQSLDALMPELQTKNIETRLIDYAQNEDDILIALINYHHNGRPTEATLKSIGHLAIDDKEEVFRQYFSQSPPLPELDFFHYTFEICLNIEDYLRLRQSDIHAIMLQDTSVFNGYVTPPEILDSPHHGDYIAALKRVIKAYDQIKTAHPEQAQYMVPRAFQQKALLTLNLNQLYTLHITPAEELWDKVRKVHPTMYQGLKKKLL